MFTFTPANVMFTIPEPIAASLFCFCTLFSHRVWQHAQVLIAGFKRMECVP
jgi:hypothetical protein